MTKKTQTPRPAQPSKPKTYIVFGADEYAKPRAARFSTDYPELLAKAVETMHLRMVEVTDDDLAEIATKLPAGRLHANGRGLVPYVKGDLYFELVVETVGDQEPPANPNPTAQDLPRSWDDIAPGHLVIARETPAARPGMGVRFAPVACPNPMESNMDPRTQRIRALNDQLRQNLSTGVAMMTPGVAALGQEAVERIVKTIAVFDDFCHANDPYEEHDFGSFEAEGHTIFFKIDLYEEPDVKGANGDPVVTRVLTIMLADEY